MLKGLTSIRDRDHTKLMTEATNHRMKVKRIVNRTPSKGSFLRALRNSGGKELRDFREIMRP